MKFKKTSVILLAVLTVFATLLCLYSNKLSSESVSASRIFSGQIEVVNAETSDESCPDNDCSDKDCEDGKCSDNSDIDPDFSKRPKKNKGFLPRIGKRKPRPDMPRVPTPNRNN